MAASTLFWIGLGWGAITTLVQWLRRALALGWAAGRPSRHKAADFSIVAPLAGIHDASEAYIGRLAELARVGAEVLICVASERDEAVARVRAQWPGAPILFGNDSTFNPKLNNVRKGLEAASRPAVALCAAGVALTAGDLVTAAAQLLDEVGLVLALKAGERPENFAAEMECAYLNGHQARFLLAVDRLGMPRPAGARYHT